MLDPKVSAARLPSRGALAGAALCRAKDVVTEILDAMASQILSLGSEALRGSCGLQDRHHLHPLGALEGLRPRGLPANAPLARHGRAWLSADAGGGLDLRVPTPRGVSQRGQGWRRPRTEASLRRSVPGPVGRAPYFAYLVVVPCGDGVGILPRRRLVKESKGRRDASGQPARQRRKTFAMGLKAGRSWLESLQLILVLPQWLTRILGCRESI